MDVKDKDYLTTLEAAEYIGVKRTFFLECCRNYNIPRGKLGKNVIFRKRDLQKFIEEQAFKTTKTRR